MLVRPTRAFVARRLVQRQIRLGTVVEVQATHAERQVCAVEALLRIGHQFAGDDDLLTLDQCLALASRADTLRLQNSEQGQFGHQSAGSLEEKVLQLACSSGAPATTRDFNQAVMVIP